MEVWSCSQSLIVGYMPSTRTFFTSFVTRILNLWQVHISDNLVYIWFPQGKEVMIACHSARLVEALPGRHNCSSSKLCYPHIQKWHVCTSMCDELVCVMKLCFYVASSLRNYQRNCRFCTNKSIRGCAQLTVLRCSAPALLLRPVPVDPQRAVI